eukprot:13661041-Alexandrium_andersonii.AAC.1
MALTRRTRASEGCEGVPRRDRNSQLAASIGPWAKLQRARVRVRVQRPSGRIRSQEMREAATRSV